MSLNLLRVLVFFTFLLVFYFLRHQWSSNDRKIKENKSREGYLTRLQLPQALLVRSGYILFPHVLVVPPLVITQSFGLQSLLSTLDTAPVAWDTNNLGLGGLSEFFLERVLSFFVHLQAF